MPRRQHHGGDETADADADASTTDAAPPMPTTTPSPSAAIAIPSSSPPSADRRRSLDVLEAALSSSANAAASLRSGVPYLAVRTPLMYVEPEEGDDDDDDGSKTTSPQESGLAHLLADVEEAPNEEEEEGDSGHLLSGPAFRTTRAWSRDVSGRRYGDGFPSTTTTTQPHPKESSGRALEGDIVQEQEQQEQHSSVVGAAATNSSSIVSSIVLGVVNFVVCTPTLVSYAAIVFRAHVFHHQMTKLTKLFFLSSALHQLAMSLLSKLPFAVGQVQDVGLIILSQIAGNVAKRNPDSPAVATATALVACTLATFLVGVGLFFVGRYRLGGIVQLFPLAAVAGYLGYIGYFCLAAGASLSTGLTISEPSSWRAFVDAPGVVWLQVLAAAVQAGVIWATGYVRSPFALPVVLLSLPVLFFVTIYALGVSAEEARDNGWLLGSVQASAPPWGWEVYDIYAIPKAESRGWLGLDWGGVVSPAQVANALALFVVVSFGSSLDIAAVQAGQEAATQGGKNPYEVDFDHELSTIGLANAVVGLSGSGFTGSYIFSQTIFSQKQNAGRLNGALLCVLELVLFVCPFDVLQLMPGSYVGAIMAYFGVEIMNDWLVAIRKKVTPVEHALVFATFLATLFLNVLGGMAVGFVLGALVFVFMYARVRVGDVRAPEVPLAAAVRGDGAAVALRIVQLRGYLFFGQSLSLSEHLHREIVASLMTAVESESGDGAVEKVAFFCIVDFEAVDEIDSTAANALRTCIKNLSSAHGTMSVPARIFVVLSGVKPKSGLAGMLEAHGVIADAKDDVAAVGREDTSRALPARWYDRHGRPPRCRCLASARLLVDAAVAA